MSFSPQELDGNGHVLGCPQFGQATVVDPANGQVNLFCDCHTWAEPMILANGTDVAFPAGWDEARALAWRAENGLAAPAPI